ncbi:TetR/AcrR family transcriptional regulator [Azospirillum picis]|uniref:AcrR family transcriptional regulator n=1 Tax=Azospirillum picis TaxID=488438 RepID=A0ABU0MJG7_9PROT|nr:TetR/AcrR family transcriptional regulator [Azospirillum picis]MBP2299728.1 AcrR family transcriptional regulator [Azospirillum picis]MDQ0533524.1 AcrR family transcriptional regulator [Azospirillum picis]
MPDTGLGYRDGKPATDEPAPDLPDAAASGMGLRGWARYRALLDAASTLFVEKGYAATSLSDVLRLAGGSRTTLYTRFGDKDGLFRAMMEEHCARVLAGMTPDTAPDSAADPEERLTRIALHIADTLMAPETTAILRTLISEGVRVPDLVETFVRVGPDRTRARLAACLDELQAAGLIRIEDPEMAAQAFCGMVTGNLLLERLILPGRPVDRAAVETYVRECVRLFLRGAAA